MRELTVPKLNNNDDAYILVEWLFGDGDTVPAGAEVAVLETSKVAEDFVCEQGGVLQRLAAEKSECRPGDVIGLLFATDEERQRHLAKPTGPDHPAGTGAQPASESEPELIITAAARALMVERGVTSDQLRTLGKTVIKRSDVERLLTAAPATPAPAAAATPGAGAATAAAAPTTTDAAAAAASASTVEISRHQRAVAGVVSESHRTIPAAYALAKVEVSAALALTAEQARRSGHPVGLTELLIRTVARLRPQFPLCFARLSEDGATATVPEASHVAVTVDVGRGLFMPVVRDADTRSLASIAETLTDFRIKALRGGFREEEFADAGIAVSLNNDDGIVFAVPIVFPGTACMVTLGGVVEELGLGADGRPAPRRVCHVGLAYDHRLVNGREAMAFLQRVRTALQAPGEE